MTAYVFAEGECLNLPKWIGEQASTCCWADTDKCNDGVIIAHDLDGLCTALYTIR